MTIEWVQECESCSGTGLYQGVAERDGAAVVCVTCKGTGRQHVKHEYNEFTGRKKAENVSRVYRTGAGIVLAPSVTSGGVPLEEWERNPDSVNAKGAELRSHTCPRWWLQVTDYDRQPKWDECKNVSLGGSFSKCHYFPRKAACWTRLDEEEQSRRYLE